MRLCFFSFCAAVWVCVCVVVCGCACAWVGVRRISSLCASANLRWLILLSCHTFGMTTTELAAYTDLEPGKHISPCRIRKLYCVMLYCCFSDQPVNSGRWACPEPHLLKEGFTHTKVNHINTMRLPPHHHLHWYVQSQLCVIPGWDAKPEGVVKVNDMTVSHNSNWAQITSN